MSRLGQMSWTDLKMHPHHCCELPVPAYTAMENGVSGGRTGGKILMPRTSGLRLLHMADAAAVINLSQCGIHGIGIIARGKMRFERRTRAGGEIFACQMKSGTAYPVH